MTDRELLEPAAKAAGLRHIQYTNDYDGSMGLMQCDEHGRHTYTWNPLLNDGDAFRLAADLRLDVLWAEHSPSVVVNNDSWANESNLVEVRESYFHSTKYEALRRAIVIAAAELAKQDKS